MALPVRACSIALIGDIGVIQLDAPECSWPRLPPHYSGRRLHFGQHRRHAHGNDIPIAKELRTS
jgi:hypothetical protein